ncbi:hypothetical protein ABT121_13140 [Streptomyces sp. NPDC001928]|uniref:hypothetical protein n=1 Tax=Streptomyces sp. NPDC001928 TaxID=3154404 RepID=UPI00332A9C4C
MPSHMAKAAAVALASITAVLISGAPSSAADVPWDVAHRTATAQGTRAIETGPLNSTLVVKGELTNTGDGCYSVWFRITNDFVPGPTVKHATQCGPGSTPIDFRTTTRLTTTGSVFICKSETREDCGDRKTITSWPVHKPAVRTN